MDTRPIEICDAQKPVCPKCGTPFRRIWVEDGTTYAHCLNKRQSGSPGRPSGRAESFGVCGQHAAIVAVDGVAAVSPLGREEFSMLQQHMTHLVSMRRQIQRSLREAS